MILIALALSATHLFSPTTALSDALPVRTHTYIYDRAQILPTQTTQGLNDLLRRHDEETSQTVVLVTVPTVDLGNISSALADLYTNIIAHDTGVLVVVAAHPIQSFVTVGRALRTRLPNETIQSIQDAIFDPLSQSGRSQEAISRSIAAIVSKLVKAQHPHYVPPTPSPLERFVLEDGGPLLLLYLLLLFPVWLASILARSKRWWPGGVLGFVGGMLISWILVEMPLAAVIGGVIMGTIGFVFDYVVSRHHEHVLHYGKEHAWWAGGRWARRFDHMHRVTSLASST